MSPHYLAIQYAHISTVLNVQYNLDVSNYLSLSNFNHSIYLALNFLRLKRITMEHWKNYSQFLNIRVYLWKTVIGLQDAKIWSRASHHILDYLISKRQVVKDLILKEYRLILLRTIKSHGIKKLTTDISLHIWWLYMFGATLVAISGLAP